MLCLAGPPSSPARALRRPEQPGRARRRPALVTGPPSSPRLLPARVIEYLYMRSRPVCCAVRTRSRQCVLSTCTLKLLAQPKCPTGVAAHRLAYNSFILYSLYLFLLCCAPRSRDRQVTWSPQACAVRSRVALAYGPCCAACAACALRSRAARDVRPVRCGPVQPGWCDLRVMGNLLCYIFIRYIL